MNTSARRTTTTAAALGAAGLAVLTFGAPAQAATTLTGPDGQSTILLSDQDVQGLNAPHGLDHEGVCGTISYDVSTQRGHSFDFFSCLDVTRDCIAKVGTDPQINLYPNNSYSCTQYSTDGSLFAWIAKLLIP